MLFRFFHDTAEGRAEVTVERVGGVSLVFDNHAFVRLSPSRAKKLAEALSMAADEAAGNGSPSPEGGIWP